MLIKKGGAGGILTTDLHLIRLGWLVLKQLTKPRETPEGQKWIFANLSNWSDLMSRSAIPPQLERRHVHACELFCPARKFAIKRQKTIRAGTARKMQGVCEIDIQCRPF